MNLELKHFHIDDKEALGLLTIYSKGGKLLMVASTLERAFNGHLKIQKGTHKLVKYYSPSKQCDLWMFDSPEDKGHYFELHIGNLLKDSTACVLVGNGFANINGDEEIDIINSRGTFKRFMKLTAGLTTLTIKIV